MTPLKAEYITADQLPLIIFRLQLRGGPYIPITSTRRPVIQIHSPRPFPHKLPDKSAEYRHGE
jgi:hypothetical protein